MQLFTVCNLASLNSYSEMQNCVQFICLELEFDFFFLKRVYVKFDELSFYLCNNRIETALRIVRN